MPHQSIATRELLLVVLRLLEELPMSAAGLLEELERLLGSDPRVRPGAVLVALSSLEAEGLVTIAAPGGVAGGEVEADLHRLTERGSEEAARRSRRPATARMEQVSVMFTDVVGSTELLERFGEDEAHDLRRRHFDLLRGAVDDHRGREVKNLGDGLMVVFESPPAAAACGLEMQRAVDSCDDPLELRVGIAVGETVREDDDHFGRPVVLAKRLCDVAEAGTVLVTGQVRGLMPDTAVERQRLEPLTLKGLSEPVTPTLLRARPLAACG